jgi:hypothetical protein
MVRKSAVIVVTNDLIKRSGYICVLVVILLVGLTNGQATAGQTYDPFEAAFAGNFYLTGDVGKSVLFMVAETGSGYEVEKLGAFTYTTSLFNNLALTPPGCGSGSSTGADGSAVLTFADGQLRLHRVSGTVCFSFPTIRVVEQWVIASGTGAYIGATGNLSRQLTGDVRFGTSVGSLSGTIRNKLALSYIKIFEKRLSMTW